jgi:subtilisin family serine protease
MMFGNSASFGNARRKGRAGGWRASARSATRSARSGKWTSRPLVLESLEVRSMLSASGTGLQPAEVSPDPAIQAAIAQAANLSNYTAAQLSQVTDWVVGYSAGTSPMQLASEVGASFNGVTGLIQNSAYLSFPANTSAASAQQQLDSLAGVVWAYPLVSQQPQSQSFPTNPTPNDPLFSQEWQLVNTGQTGGIKGADANVQPAWQQGDLGQGVTIGVVDNGVFHAHPDLAPNYNAALSYNFDTNNPDPSPVAPIPAGGDHGTEVAGVAAAAANNSIGVAGAAPSASIAGITLTAAPTTDKTKSQAIEFDDQQIPIYNNSWGPNQNGTLDSLTGPLLLAAIADAAANGRGGLGSIYVVAGGDGQSQQANTNYSLLANSRYTIAVGALDDHGNQATYSDSGASLLVSAYAGGQLAGAAGEHGIPTTDVVNNTGTNPVSLQAAYTNDGPTGFTGTSAAAPLVSGVIALMLEANPTLNYRDVQLILAQSAVKNDATDTAWTTNGATFTTDGVNFQPYHVNDKFGFGAIDAAAAVNLAKNWTDLLPLQRISSGVIKVNQGVPVGAGAATSSITLSGLNLHVERVEVVLDAAAANRGDLTVTLTSPNGTQSVLARTRTTDANANYTGWVFTTTRDMGENVSGTWTLSVTDPNTASAGATFTDWTLNVYGTTHYAPVAQNGSVGTNENQAANINLLANTFDSETGTVFGGAVVPTSLTIVAQPAHGTVSVNSSTGVVTYTPNKDFVGTDTFTYTVLDNFGNVSRTATETVNVAFVDQPPAAVNDTAIDSPGHAVQIQVLANDIPGNSAINPATVTIVNPPSQGTAVVSSSGVVTYTAGAGFIEGDSFTYDVQDVNGGVSNVATVTVLRNFPEPTAVADAETQGKNQTVTINVLANDIDPNPAGLNPASVTIVTGPAFGSASVDPVTGLITYTPLPNFFGTDTLTYTVADAASGEVSNDALVTITVLNVGPPVALNHEFVLVPNFSSVHGISLLDNPTNSGTLTPFLVTPTSLGTVVLNADGSINYQQGPNFQGLDSFTYVVNDGAINSNVATIRLVSTNFHFVEKLYQDVLHRTGSDAEIMYWTGLLNRGVSLQSVALALVSSPEADTFVINGIYERMLNRPADIGGLFFWQSEMLAGVTPEQITAAIASSAEYAALNGGTDEGYVIGLYADVLGRSALLPDIEYWTSVLASGVSRFDVATLFLNTTEYRARQINAYFEAYLGHPGDANNPVSFYQQLYQEGATDAVIQSIILASPEFYRIV